MLVTFHSKTSGSFTMFGDVAVTLLKLTGHSGTVPSALLADDVPSALAHLQQGLASAGPGPEIGDSDWRNVEDADTPPPVGLQRRAYPLIQMLSAAARDGCDVMWEEGAPLV